jgi:predicted MFS family arabinose efflux permease
MKHKLEQQQLPLPAWILQHVQADDKQNTPNPLELWHLLKKLLTDRTVLPFFLLVSLVFGCMFLLLLQLSELLLSAAHLSPLKVGICYLATGGFSMAGSLLGGWSADRADAAPQAALTARLEMGSLVTLLLTPAGLLLVGWTEPLGWTGPVAVVTVLIGGSAVCFGASFLSPGGYSYLSQRSKTYAAAVGSLTAAVSARQGQAGKNICTFTRCL